NVVVMPSSTTVAAVAFGAITLLAGFARPAGAVTWSRPVAEPVSRPFAMPGSPFLAGRHRGVDFAAPRGSPVGAPCGGRVAVAGRIGTSGGVVTIACGRW